jgi:hypothetical protein
VRSQFDVIYTPRENLFRCVPYAKVQKLNMAGSTEPTLELTTEEFLDRSQQLIRSCLEASHKQIHTEPNRLYADDARYAKLCDEGLVLIFSALLHKPEMGIQLRAMTENSNRYTLPDSLTPEQMKHVLSRHFIERFGEEYPNPFL